MYSKEQSEAEKKGNKKYKDQYSSLYRWKWQGVPCPPPPPRRRAVPFNLSREVETFSCLLTSLPYQQVSGDGARGGQVSRSEGRKSLGSVILSVCFCLACFPTIGFQHGVCFKWKIPRAEWQTILKALCEAIVAYVCTSYPRLILPSLGILLWLPCKVEFNGNVRGNFKLRPKKPSQRSSAARVSEPVHPQVGLFIVLLHGWPVNKTKNTLSVIH